MKVSPQVPRKIRELGDEAVELYKKKAQGGEISGRTTRSHATAQKDTVESMAPASEPAAGPVEMAHGAEARKLGLTRAQELANLAKPDGVTTRGGATTATSSTIKEKLQAAFTYVKSALVSFANSCKNMISSLMQKCVNFLSGLHESVKRG